MFIDKFFSVSEHTAKNSMAEVYLHRTCVSKWSQSTEIDKAVMLSNPFQKALRKKLFLSHNASNTKQPTVLYSCNSCPRLFFILIHLVVSCYTEYKWSTAVKYNTSIFVIQCYMFRFNKHNIIITVQIFLKA
jgi:hypothetical protein